MNQRALEAHAKQALGVDFHGTTADGAFSLRAGVLPGQLRVLAGDDDRRRAVRPRDARAASTNRRPTWENALMPPVTVYVPRDAGALSLGADEVARAIAAEAAAREDSTSASCATARAACAGSSRSSKSQTPAGRVAYGPVDAGRCRGLFDAGFLNGGDAPAAPRSGRGDPVFRHARSGSTFARVGIIDPVEPRRLPRARRLQRA